MSNNFFKRAIFGAVFVAALLFGTFYKKESFFIVFLFLLVVGIVEFYNFARKAGAKPSRILGVSCAVTLFSAGFLHSFFNDPTLYFIVVLELFIICIFELFRKTETPLQNIASLFAGLVYVALPLTLTQYLIYDQYNPLFVLNIFFIIWACDTGAYLVGSTLGRTPLFIRISPNKTWEGAVGGLVLAIIVASFLPERFTQLDLIDRIAVALIIVVAGTFGDLFQSLLKRSINVKDSGTILPGHGGILDRIDSMLFAIPAVFVYLKLIGYINNLIL